MSYCRFIEADAYVFFNGKSLECCACILRDENEFSFRAYSTGDMVKHLWRHQNNGDYIPEYVFDNLWLDNEENFGGNNV
jgi:hypothetical protein